MSFDIEDPRLTAYVLGELDDKELAEMEAMLASDSEAQAYVESLREATDALADELGAALSEGDALSLGEIRRAGISRAAKPDASRPWKLWAVGGALSAAAAWMIVLASSEPGVQVQIRHLSVPALTTDSSTTKPSAPNRSRNQSMIPGGSFAPSGSLHSPRAMEGQEAPANVVRGRISAAQRKQLEALGYFGGNDIDPSYRQEEPTVESDFVSVSADPLSTFSVDVDTASYSQVRRSLRSGRIPPSNMIRIEEMINYFSYDYPAPHSSDPFGVVTEVSQAPWNPAHKLVRIGVKAKDIIQDRRPRANLVFLLDVSGSMNSPDKLPLLKRSFALLLERLDSEDRIAIVVYAGASGVVLPSTSVSKRDKIQRALEQLNSGGSTNGGAGIEMAYRIAQENFMKGGINRVILATDGDFNVGTTSRPALIDLITNKAQNDVFLTVLGFGDMNASDTTMEQLADKGNGNYAYIDRLAEAQKVLVDQVHATLVTVAKDVKLQVEFNPRRVAQYRLIGYENRVMAHEDFNDDRKDAGEVGAGHAVTALYEVVPPGLRDVDALRYQKNDMPSVAAASDELLTLKVRFKAPTGDVSELRQYPILDQGTRFSDASHDFKFASAVAAFGMLLRNSEHKGNATYRKVGQWARAGEGVDSSGHRAEFVDLVGVAEKLRGE